MKRVITMMLAVMLTARMGTIQYDGHKETWYNLRMNRVVERAAENGIAGEYWERADGCKMIGKYIICAGAKNRYGEVVETSRGLGIILDTGTFADKEPDLIDLATTWGKGGKK